MTMQRIVAANKLVDHMSLEQMRYLLTFTVTSAIALWVLWVTLTRLSKRSNKLSFAAVAATPASDDDDC